MMYTELYSFEGTAATDAGKTSATLEKAKEHSGKLVQKHGGAAGTVRKFLRKLIPGTLRAGK